jgi:hypothetical protein
MWISDDSFRGFYAQGLLAGAEAARRETPRIPASGQELLVRATDVVRALPGPVSSRDEHEYYAGWIDGYMLICGGARPVMMQRGRAPRGWTRPESD